MTKSLNKIIDAILLVVKNSPQGISLEDIFRLVDPPIPKRSLQRYLVRLTKNNQLSTDGKTRNKHYFLPPEKSKEKLVITSSENDKTENFISLSSSSLMIQSSVRQPLQARIPVGYNQSFLNDYRPNESFYLSEDVRKHLYDVGKSPESERPAGTYARQILNRLLIDLSWNSSRLEGNTYSLLETERLLELGEVSEGKDSREAQMILNHKAAIEYLVESAGQLKFNKFTILNLHALLSDNLLHDPRASGSLRSNPVGIAKSVYQPLAIPQLIEEYFQQILDTANAIINPFEQSFFMMVHLPYLQPFLDVNKRVSRLAANIPLIRENLIPLSFVDVPEKVYVSGLLGIYELNRIELMREVFVWAYERSSSLYSATRQELGEPDPFRLRYRDLIKSLVGEIVRKSLDKKTAVTAIKQSAVNDVALADQAKFIEVIEIELMSLHIGNIARFRLTPLDYETWLKTWR